MKIISFNILYWNGSDFTNRLKNVNFCWEKLKKFSRYAIDKGLDVKIQLFDFSYESILPEAIHIPYMPGTYRRSEKINLVLEYNYINIKPEIICIIDSDVFFETSEYDKLIDEINNFDPKNRTIYNLKYIINNNGIDFINNSLNHIISHTNFVDGLGGFFMIYFDELFKIGGFDERFIVWGGEDNDVAERLDKNGIEKRMLSIELYHLPHQSLMIESHKTKEYHEQCKLIGNNDIITKYSLITNKYLNL